MRDAATPLAATLEDAGVRHAVEADRIERWFLSAGFWSPAALATEMTKHGLRVHDFTGPFHREVCAALLGHADLGVDLTVESMRFVTERLGADWSIGDGGNLERIIWGTSHWLLAGHYATLLAGAVARRKRVRELLFEAESLLSGRPLPVATPTIPVEPARPKRPIPTVPCVRRGVACAR